MFWCFLKHNRSPFSRFIMDLLEVRAETEGLMMWPSWPASQSRFLWPTLSSFRRADRLNQSSRGCYTLIRCERVGGWRKMSLMLLFFTGIWSRQVASAMLFWQWKKRALANEDCSLSTEAQRCSRDNSRVYAKVYWKSTHTHKRRTDLWSPFRHIKPIHDSSQFLGKMNGCIM